MHDRPDCMVLVMAALSVAAGVILALAVRNWYGFTVEQSLFVANLGFSISCYLTTFSFRYLIGEPELHEALKSRATEEVDLSELCRLGIPCKPTAEKIWSNKRLSRWVLVYTYAADTKSGFRRIVGNVFFAMLFLIVLIGGILLSWTPTPPNPAAFVSPGLTSLLTFTATLVFTIFRVYIPIVDMAQRNNDVLTEL
jgi:hypothetical protein